MLREIVGVHHRLCSTLHLVGVCFQINHTVTSPETMGNRFLVLSVVLALAVAGE